MEEFQSTHPWRVWLGSAEKNCLEMVISIHTPVKGVTLVCFQLLWVEVYFNPHTREGCDFQTSAAIQVLRYFNPHTREGCDTKRKNYCLILLISIHTPVKGVTSNFQNPGWSSDYFNPHTREGCDHPVLFPRSSDRYFNPHTREGCDLVNHPVTYISSISIHTPVKGVTEWIIMQYGTDIISIHTPVKGVTIRYSWAGRIWEFQSTHPWRVWQISKILDDLLIISIHTPVKGVTGNFFVEEIIQTISIHTPVKGVTPGADFVPPYSTFQSTHPWRVWPVILMDW